MIFLLSVTELLPLTIDARVDLRPQAARLVDLNRFTTLQRLIQEIELSHMVGEIERHRREQPDDEITEPDTQQQTRRQPNGEDDQLRYPALRHIRPRVARTGSRLRGQSE